jgi:hypothetical protein
MKATRIVSALVAGLLALSSHSAGACGDKFIRVGRGGRFQRGYVAVHPASILVYVNKGSAGAASMGKLPAVLKAAGHRAEAVDTMGAFTEALKARRYDLVLAENPDVAGVVAAINGATPKPSVLPVLRGATPAQVGAAAREHGCVIEDAEKKYDVLMDIDQMMEGRK